MAYLGSDRRSSQTCQKPTSGQLSRTRVTGANRPKANLCVVEDMPVSSFRRILLHVLRCQILLSCRTTDSRFQNGGGCMKRWLLVTLAVLCFGVYAFSQTADELVNKNIEARGG